MIYDFICVLVHWEKYMGGCRHKGASPFEFFT